MIALSFTLVTWIFAQLSAGLPQDSALGSALPAITGPSGEGPTTQCGGCYVVADVAGVVFGNQVINQTVAMEIVSIATGRNGSQSTFTSFVQNVTPFTFGPTGLLGTASPVVPLTLAFESTIITFSGVTLTSPTAYNVFTAYSVTSTILTNGACLVVSDPPMPVIPAVSVPVPTGTAPANFAFSALQSFIRIVGLPTCSPGGENPVQQTVTPVANITVTTTTTGAFSFTPQPITISTSGITATETSITASSANSPLASIVPPGVTLGPNSVVSATRTTTVAVQTVVIVANSSTTTATLSATIPVIIAANSTYPLPDGLGPNVTIVPFVGRGATLNGDLGSSWVLWGSGVLAIILAAWIL